MIQLTPAERRALRAEAHHLQPVVMIGNHGLSEAVLKEIDANLKAHGLIKVRVLSEERGTRELFFHEIAHQLKCAPVQHIGKLLVLWRQPEVREKIVEAPNRSRRTTTGKGAKHFARATKIKRFVEIDRANELAEKRRQQRGRPRAR